MIYNPKKERLPLHPPAVREERENIYLERENAGGTIKATISGVAAPVDRKLICG